MPSRPIALERDFLVVGIVVLLVVPVGALALGETGSAYNLEERPSTPFVRSAVSPGSAPWSVVCGPIPGAGPTEECAPDSQFVGASSLDYVAGTDQLVFADGGGSTGGWFVVGAASGTVESETYIDCYLWGAFYFGSGPDVYSNCAGEFSPMGLIRDTIVVFNVTAQKVTEEIPVGLYYGCQPFDLALDPTMNRLYCVGNGTELLTFSVSSGRLVTVTPLPFIPEPMSVGLWFDPWTRDLILNDFTPTWYEVNPANGSVVATLVTPGRPEGMALSSQSGVAYLGWSAGTTEANLSNGVRVVNLTTFTEFASISIPWTGAGSWGDWFDRSGRVVYLGFGNDEYAVNTSSNSLISGSVYLGNSSLYSVAYDPTRDTFSTASCAPKNGEFPSGDCALAFLPVVHGIAHSSPYSAVPFFGTFLPADLAVLGIASGGALLAMFQVLRQRRLRSENITPTG